MIKWLAVALVLLVPSMLGVVFIQGVAAGGGGTDFTADANAIGCWLLFSDGTETGAEADRCSAGGTDNMTAAGTFAIGTSTPSGTASGQDAVTFDADDEFSLADQNEFEAADFTAGCWSYHTVTGNDALFSKGKLATWELFKTSGLFRGTVKNVAESTPSSLANSTWWLTALRYDGTGSSADAGDDLVEIFVNGLIDCDGACASSVDPTGNTDNLVVGADSAGASDWVGQLMDCAYFDRVLTDTEMCEWMLCGLDGTADGAARDTAFGAAGCQCSDITTCC